MNEQHLRKIIKEEISKQDLETKLVDLAKQAINDAGASENDFVRLATNAFRKAHYTTKGNYLGIV